jgi:hypothetical protein
VTVLVLTKILALENEEALKLRPAMGSEVDAEWDT